MSDLTDLSELLPEFKAACAAANVTPRAALRAGGIDPSLWLKWEQHDASPTLRSLEAAQTGLRSLIETKEAAA